MKLLIAFAGVGLSACVSQIDDPGTPTIFISVSAQHDKTLVRPNGDVVVGEEGYQPLYQFGDIPTEVTLPLTIDGIPVVLPFPCSPERVRVEIVSFLAIDVVDDSTIVGVMSSDCYDRDNAVSSGAFDQTVTIDRKHLPPPITNRSKF